MPHLVKAAAQSIKTFPPGIQVFKEGQRGNEAYVILEGLVLLTKKEGVLEKELAQLTSGSVFGEMALIDGGTRSASALTKKQTRMIVIDNQTFQVLLQMLPLWLRSILKIVSSRLRDSNRNLLNSPELPLLELLKQSLKLEASLIKSPAGLDYYRLLEELALQTQQSREKIASLLTQLANEGFLSLPMSKGSRSIVLDPKS